MDIENLKQLECEHEWGEPEWIPNIFDGDAEWLYTCQKCGVTLKTCIPLDLSKNSINVEKGIVKTKRFHQ